MKNFLFGLSNNFVVTELSAPSKGFSCMRYVMANDSAHGEQLYIQQLRREAWLLAQKEIMEWDTCNLNEYLEFTHTNKELDEMEVNSKFVLVLDLEYNYYMGTDLSDLFQKILYD